MEGLRRRRGGGGDSGKAETAGGRRGAQARRSRQECHCSHLPMFDEVLSLLPARSIGRLKMVDRESRKATEFFREKVLLLRDFGADWSWRKAHAVEAAIFHNSVGLDDEAWAPGPNTRVTGNVLERGSAHGAASAAVSTAEAGEWLWLSGGTDWQAFQGGLQTVSEEGVRPSWVSFKVGTATPLLSGANFAIAGDQGNWGLRRPIIHFSYRGGDCNSNQHSFLLETCVAAGAGYMVPHACRPAGGVRGGQAYEVAICLDWSRGTLSAYVDGERLLEGIAFEKEEPVRLVAVYNWRSNARTAFSEFLVGGTCPYELGEAWRRAGNRSSLLPCCRRRVASIGSPASKWPISPWALGAVAATGLALGVSALPWLQEFLI